MVINNVYGQSIKEFRATCPITKITFSEIYTSANAKNGKDFLADALSKIKNDRIPLAHASRATSHLYISSPYKGDFIENLMSTHPNTDERIQRLRNMQLRSK